MCKYGRDQTIAPGERNMRHKNITRKQNISTAIQSPLKWSGLQARMTFSYVWVTIACILLLEILVLITVSIAFFLLTHQQSSQLIPAVEQTARQEAGNIASRLASTHFDPHTLSLGDPNFSSL